jgi:hypothetical protein
VVHEAVEALGNLSQDRTEELLKEYQNKNHKDSQMLYETCFLAKELIRWNKDTNTGKTEKLDFSYLNYKTNDPAPPFNIYGGIS